MARYQVRMILIIAAIGAVLLSSSPATAGDAVSKAVDAYVAAWNTGDMTLLDGAVSEQVKRHEGFEVTANGLAELKQGITHFRAEYENGVVVIDEMFSCGNKSAARWSFTGTHKDNGAAVKSTGQSFMHWENGKIVEEWVEFDMAKWQEQLGFTVTPPPALAEAAK